jgi:hypothetical protein
MTFLSWFMVVRSFYNNEVPIVAQPTAQTRAATAHLA